MRKKIIRIGVTLLTILLIFSFMHNVNASVTDLFQGKNMVNEESGKKITEILAVALEIVRNIGVGLAILILLILGSKYMLASAGDRAEIKKHAVTYVIGAVVLFAASGILNILKEFALNATNNV